MSHMMEIPRETLEEMEHQANVIKITTGKTVSIPLNGKGTS